MNIVSNFLECVFDGTAAIGVPVDELNLLMEKFLEHFPPVYDQRTVLDYCTVAST